MPYIKDDIRRRRANLRLGDPAKTAGELNYQIFAYFKYSNIEHAQHQVAHYVGKFLCRGGIKPNYQKYNDMAGVLVLCTKELKRRLGHETKTLLNVLDTYDAEINGYEDQKIYENGDV